MRDGVDGSKRKVKMNGWFCCFLVLAANFRLTCGSRIELAYHVDDCL